MFVMPPAEYGQRWKVVIDTHDPKLAESAETGAGGKLPVEARSLVVLIKQDSA
jgi:glycogen operon protein